MRLKYIINAILKIRSLEDIRRYTKGFVALIMGFAFGPMPSKVRVNTGRTP